MNSMYYRFTLDMQTVQSQVSLPVSLNDTARTLYISFTDGGKPYSIEKGALAKLTITRPSGTKLHEFCAIQKNTSCVYPFSQNAGTAIEEGIHEAEITLYGRDGTQITSPRFTMVVSDRVVNIDEDEGIDEESIGIIDSIIQVEQLRAAAEDDRAAAEDERAEAEEERAEAETARTEAEALRVEADNTRTGNYKKIEADTISAITKILKEQNDIVAIQDKLIAQGLDQVKLSAIIDLQNLYIGGSENDD